MTTLKTMFGLCVLFAITICAFTAQSAPANTAYLCSTTASKLNKRDAHCREDVGFEAIYGHKEINPLTVQQVLEGKGTPVTLTNVTTGDITSVAKVKSVQSGVTLELSATGVHGEGTLENTEELAGNVMFAHGDGKITLTGVQVALPAGKGCKVPGGTVTTKEVTFTTKGQIANSVKIEPGSSAGGILAEFTIEGCSIPELNHVYTATGSVLGAIEGATTRFVHATTTTPKTLKLFGQNAGLDGTITIKDKATGEGVVLT